ncbi:response regulator [candidate division WOR-3 bacterium]|nr:response regulator [candidate division WOR-3 bacterium]
MERKILIIEDGENLAQLLEDMLLELNEEDDIEFIIKKAYSASEGISVALDFKPDVVLLDLKLPDSPGTEVLTKLKQEDRDIQVIIMTGHASIESAVHSIREEAYDYIQKPLPSGNHLKALVKSALDRRQLLLDKTQLLIELSEANEAFEEANRALEDEKLLVNNKLENKIKELSHLNEFSQDLLQYHDLAKMIEEIPKKTIEVTQSDGAVLILKEGEDKKYTVHSTVGDVSLSPGDDIKINEEPFGLVNNKGPWATEDYICCPLSFIGEPLGVIAIKKSEEEISPELIETIAANLSISLHDATLYDRLKASYLEAVLSLIMVEETADPNIKEHSQRVSNLSLKFADLLEVSVKEKNDIRYAALLHGLGKISQEKVDSSIIASRIISPFKFLKNSRIILKHLYENYDGSGKPEGLKEERIPIGSRIIRLSYEVEKLISENKNPEEISKAFEGDSGTLYDPKITKLIKDIL